MCAVSVNTVNFSDQIHTYKDLVEEQKYNLKAASFFLMAARALLLPETSLIWNFGSRNSKFGD